MAERATYTKQKHKAFLKAARIIRSDMEADTLKRCMNSGDTVTVDYFRLDEVLDYVEEMGTDIEILNRVREGLQFFTAESR